MKKNLLLLLLMICSLSNAQTPATGPSTPPVRNSWDVLSQYGSAYTNQPGVAFNDFGGSTIVGDVTLTDNSVVKKYTGHSYSGISTNGSYSLNVSGMTRLHLDVWSPDFVSFKIKLEAVNGSQLELEVPFTKTQGSWNSYDLNLSTYTGVDFTNLKWIVPVTFGPNNTTLFISNVYFWRPATTQPPTFGTFTIPAKLVGAANFAISAPTTNSSGAITYTSSNTSVATIVGGSQVHIVGAGASTITATQAANGGFASGFTSTTLSVTYPPLIVDAPTSPVRNSWDVISLYSSSYTDLAGINWYPNWGQSTSYSTYTPNVNETRQYQNLNYQGVQLAANTNISDMSTLHVDIYSPDATALDFRIIAGGEFNKTLTLTPGQWNSFDIPLSQYAGANLAVLNQLKFQTNPYGGALRNIVYLDNVYFYRTATSLPSPSLSAFTLPSKVVGDSNFLITNPTSNSSGTFSYTSSNTSVATVSGNTITVVGLGSTTITATQAASTSYGIGTITTLFNVTPAAAPIPTVSASNVISLFSDVFTNVAGTDWFPNWGQSTVVSDLSIQGNTTKKYTNLNYQGIQFSSPINASGMVSLHLDVWTQNCTTLDMYLINQPAPEQKVTLTPTLNGWNSFDILLSQFTNINLSNIGQMKFVGTNGSGLYLDNIYFSNVPLTVSPSISGFTISNKELGVAPFNLSAPTSTSAGAFTYTSSDTAVATVSGNTVTVVGLGTTIITANQAANGNYLSGSITANLQVIAPLPTSPTVAAPTPPVRVASDVKSLFSDAYTNISGTDWYPNWGQSTQITDLTIAGNNTKKYSNMNYQGVNFAAAVNASSMTNLHIDVWTSNVTSFEVYPIVPGQAEQKVTLTPTLAGWNSFDIDLTQYTIPLANIMQMKFVASPSGGAVFLDNIYFWKPNTTPNITGFVVPAKILGAAPFTLSAPSSNSPGTFSYSSSNTSVATISGSTVTIVGAGSSTITATQAASTPFVTGFTSTTFSVSYPGPGFAPNAPTVNPAKVISLFSDTYANVAGTDWYPNWGQTTQLTDLTLSGNAVKKYSILNYEGVQFASPVNASNMTHLHLDVWTPNCTAFDVYLINQGIGEQKVTINPTLSGWNSFDIPLIQYNNIALNNIGQFKFVASPSGTSEIYLDNVYFVSLTTKIRNSQCGTTLPMLNTDILADWLQFATDYRFKVVANGTTEIIETNVRTFKLTALVAGAVYNTAYTISVAVKYNGVWGVYGAECVVTTPIVPVTKIRALQCGTTLPMLNTDILADGLQFATDYRFKVVANGTTEIIETNVRTFKLTALSAGAVYNTAYTISVAVKHNGVWGVYGAECVITTPIVPVTKVRAAQCGITLAALNTDILADWLQFATDYRFKVVANGTTEIIETNVRTFVLTALAAGAVYSTAYTISVAVKQNGVWGVYGAECIVTTPIVPVTKVRAAQCGITLAALNTDVLADWLQFATDYRFKVVANGTTEIIETNVRTFVLTALAAGAVYNTAYTISVAVKQSGVWGVYGAECVVTTPLVPVTKVCAVQCGITLAALNTDILADWLQFATDYRFKVMANGTTEIIETNVRTFKLTALAAGAIFNTTYAVSVAVKQNGVWGDYGIVCNVTTPMTPVTKVQNAQCGATLAALNTDILADWLQFATDYRFKVVANGVTRMLETNNRTFKLTALTGGAMNNTAYTISVAVKQNGVWGNYGAECIVNTPTNAATSRQMAETTSLETIDFSLLAYPNPSNNVFNFKINGANDDTISVLVFDMLGKQIENKVVNSNDIENISLGQNYSTGIYNVIVSQGMNTKTVRLVKK